jgi:serine/threonine-protein kinase
MTNRVEKLPRRLGNYELTERVGEGGMGVVYKAIDRRLGTVTAVKVIHEHLRDEPGYLERFRREAHVASLLTSPYIVQVIEFGFDKNAYYLATEYVTGTRLSEVMAKGPMDPEQALSVAVQVTLALAEADVRGVIHRDIKPENIIVTPDGSVKLMDFGIARLSYSRGVTQPGLYVGTVAYSAPEQFRGQADIRSDIYSLGVVIFQMLAGDMPFQASTIGEMIQKHAQEPPPLDRLAGLPQPIVDVVAKCLAKQPSARYQHPSELLTAIEDARDAIPQARPADDWVMTATLAIGSEHLPAGGLDRTRQYATVIAAGTPKRGYAAPADTVLRPVSAPASARQKPYVLYAIAGGAVLIAAVLGFLLLNGGSDSDNGGAGAVAAGATPAATATVSLGIAPTAEPTPVPPDRTNCDEIRGTPYRSLAEQDWFNANCLPPAAAPTAIPAAAAPTEVPTPVPPPVVAPPVTASSYSVFGFSTSTTGTSDPPPGTVGNGASLGACNPGALYAWIDYANAPVPAGFTGRWYRDGSQINETSFTQTVPTGRMFWSVSAPLPPATYQFEVYQGGSRVTSGSVTLTC